MTQTISGLACGRPIRGNVAFLGGPLQYLSELRHRFYLTLNLDEEHRIVPQNAHLFVASGAAWRTSPISSARSRSSSRPSMPWATHRCRGRAPGSALCHRRGLCRVQNPPRPGSRSQGQARRLHRPRVHWHRRRLHHHEGRARGRGRPAVAHWYGNNNGDILGTAKVIMADSTTTSPPAAPSAT